MQTATVAPAAKVTTETSKPDFGNGRFSVQMESIYAGLQKRFGISAEKAEKIARQAASDAGAIFASATASFTVGKMNKDGKVTLADACKVKGVTITNPLACVRALQWIEDAGKNGVSYGFTQWKLDSILTKWVDEMEVK